jgi:hypothetical protein
MRVAEPVPIADPRGLSGAVNGDDAQFAAGELMSYYGLTAEELRPTLLAAGPVGGGSAMSTLLVGVTLPSGATATCLVTYQRDRQEVGSTAMLSDPEQAGTAMLDRLYAVPSANALTVSGPVAGVVAEVLLEDGTLHTSIPLVAGAGVGPLPPPAPASVRIRDASGALVAEGMLSGRADG